MLVTTVPVTLMGKIHTTHWGRLSGARDSRTLLGIDFNKSTGLVIDYESQRWHFKGNRQDVTLCPEDEGIKLSGT